MTKLTGLKPGPDSLTLIIDTIEGALLPMAKSMLPKPDQEQVLLLAGELHDLTDRTYALLGAAILRWMEDANGDDADT